MRIALVKSLRMPLPQIRPWAMSGPVQRMFIASVRVMPELPRKTLKRCLDLAQALKGWRSPLVDYDAVIHNLSNRANREVRSKLSAPPRYRSDVKEWLPALDGCLITKEHVVGFKGFQAMVFFYDKDMRPRSVTGVLVDCSLRYVRIETVSGRGWYIQYNRMTAISVFQGKKLLKIIHDDLSISD